MKILFISLLSLFSVAVMAQGEVVLHDQNARERVLDGSFTAIDVTDGIELYLVSGSEEKLLVSMDDFSVEDRFKTEITDGVLKLYYKRDGVKMSRGQKYKFKAYVSFTNLNKLHASAGASVKLPEALKVKQLAIKMSSGATMKGELNAGNLQVEQNSGAEMKLSGHADQISLDVSSGAMFRGTEFSVKICQAEASSGAGIRITISEELNAKATSGGSIHYQGSGVIKDIKVNSGGVVKKI